MVRLIDTSPSFAQVHEAAEGWRQAVEAKGYHTFRVSVNYDDVINDTIRVAVYFYDSSWSSPSMPSSINPKTDRYGLGNVLNAIDKWISNLPPEHEERERQLVRDYARIKERIAASQLSDVIKAEAETLMKRLTENVLMPPEEGYATEAVIEQAAVEGPAD